MSWQSFARWGSSGHAHQATSQQASVTTLQNFLDGLMDRLNHIASSPTPLGLFQDFFTRLADMVNDLRSGSHSPAPLGVADDAPPAGQTPAPQSTATRDDHSSQAPVAPQNVLDEDDAPGSEDDQDSDDDGASHDDDDDGAGDDHQDAPDHDHAFTFRDFLDPQGGNSPALSQSLIEELAHFLKDGDGGGLAAALAQLPLFQNLPQDVRDTLQSHAVQSEESHQTAMSGSDAHGHHQWDHLI